MAVTKGHGNPKWTRDETILALDAYFALSGKNPSAKDPLIIELSKTLRALPYHLEAARNETFRNPDGVAFKVQNLRSRETGRGLTNVSRMDRELWDELGANPDEVRRLATLIRGGIAADHQSSPAQPDELEDVEFYEGRLLTQRHMRRERSPKVRSALLKARQKNGLVCEICGRSHSELAPDLREAAFEAHHLVPISEAGEGLTKLGDVALLCATCHRLIHRLIALKRRWVGIKETKILLQAIRT